MEAPSTLSQEQKLCLESVYTFTQSATVYLQAVAGVVRPEDEAQLKGLLDLGSMCLSRLPEYFPEVRPLAHGAARGGVR